MKHWPIFLRWLTVAALLDWLIGRTITRSAIFMPKTPFMIGAYQTLGTIGQVVFTLTSLLALIGITWIAWQERRTIAFSLLLLTLMMTIWRVFFIDQGSVQSAQRLITRHKVSLVFFLPAYYREKIRALPGVRQVVNQTWFGGQYKVGNWYVNTATDNANFHWRRWSIPEQP